jgi:hypothetical protein
MIARHETTMDKQDLWSALAAPLHAGAISWRRDGRVVQRDGQWYARHLAYVEANTVRERLDAVVPGEWDLTLDLLPPVPGQDDDTHGAFTCSFKARLQILGVIREDVGTGRDYKSAATDAFKRAAVRFGIGHELYAMEPAWVLVESGERWARTLEEPHAAFERRQERAPVAQAAERHASLDTMGSVAHVASATGPSEREVELAAHDEPAPTASRNGRRAAASSTTVATGNGAAQAAEPAVLDPDNVACPKCGGRTWDNRLTKRNPKAPDFKCRDRSCDGVIWPPRGAKADANAPAPQPTPVMDASPLGVGADDDDLPF